LTNLHRASPDHSPISALSELHVRNNRVVAECSALRYGVPTKQEYAQWLQTAIHADIRSVISSANMDTKATIGRITVSLTPTLLEAITRLKTRECCSISSIVEIALRGYVGHDSDEQVGVRLRAAGASRRRVLRGPIEVLDEKGCSSQKSRPQG
jgi:hypothetical protein